MRRAIVGLLALILLMISCIAAAAQCAVITFDDGPLPPRTTRLLAILHDAQVKATFYMVGKMVDAYPTTAKAVADAGHEIGNHTYNHRNLTRLSTDQVRSQIAMTDAAIAKATGVSAKTIRSPGGAQNARITSMFSRPFVLWGEHGDVKDYARKFRRASVVASRALRIHADEIMLLHDIRPTTVDAVPAIIRGLKDRGYRFVTVSEYLGGACGALARAH